MEKVPAVPPDSEGLRCFRSSAGWILLDSRRHLELCDRADDGVCLLEPEEDEAGEQAGTLHDQGQVWTLRHSLAG